MNLNNNLKEVMECKDSAKLKKFATSPNPDERQLAAANKYIDEDTQMMLTIDGNTHVKMSLGINPSITSQVAEALIDDENDKVKAAVIYNPHVSDSIKVLSLDKEQSTECTRALAKCLKTPSILKNLARSTDELTRINAAKNKNLSADVLNNMRFDQADNVRYSVAKSSKATPETLDYLSTDSDRNVRAAVAENSNTPIETLQNMADNANEVYLVINSAKINMASRGREIDLEEIREVDDIEAEI